MEENQSNLENNSNENEEQNKKSFFNSWKGSLLLGIVTLLRGALGGTLAPVFLLLGVLSVGYAIYSYSNEKSE
jgi:hypothetical protein